MIKAKMSGAEAVAQLTRGFKKIMGREPDGLEKIKIQQEAIERLKQLEKVVDMQGNVIDTSKGIVGGKQIQDNREFGEALKKYFKDRDPEDMAQGGRAGFNMGGAPSIVLNPEERERGPVFETDKVEDAIREIIKRRIRIKGAQIPISEKGQLGVAVPKLDTVGAGGLFNLLDGELEVGGIKDFGSGDEKLGFEFRKKFGGTKDKEFIKKFGGPKGERVNRKDGGMSRRQFMKIMGGLASLPILGKFFKGAKPAAKVAGVATKTPTAGQPPEYFFDLAAKIKILGKESSSAPRERMIVVNYKNYSLQEDLVTGDMTIVKRKGNEEEVMALRKGQADETTEGKTPPDEYEELTVRPDPDGKMKDVEDGIEPDSIQEIVEEVGQGGGNLDQTTLEEIARGRLASGGRASFSKGGIRTYLKNLLNFLAEKEGLKGSDQLRALNPKSFPRKIRTRMTAKQLKDVEANRAEYLQSLLDMLEADKRNLTKIKGTADQVFKESMKEAVATGDAEKIDLLKKAGRDLIRAQQERGIPYLKILRQFEDTNIDDTIAEGQKMLKDFQIKKGLRKLNASGGVAMMLGE